MTLDELACRMTMHELRQWHQQFIYEAEIEAEARKRAKSAEKQRPQPFR
jgi:hypothetical protein